jgi:hypothetical protein
MRQIVAALFLGGVLLSGGPLRPVSAQVYSAIDARRHGMELDWVSVTRLDRSDDRVQSAIATMINVEGKPEFRVLILTQRGSLEVIDGGSGSRLWNVQVGNRQYPTLGPTISDRYVSAINGSTLYVYDQADGELIYSVRLDFVPSAAPTLGPDHVYVPSMPGRVSAYQLPHAWKPLEFGDEPKAEEPWHVASAGRPHVRPLVTPRSMSWNTSRYLYVCDVHRPKVRYRMETDQEIVAESAYWAPNLIVASRDGHVYAVDERRGESVWRFSAASPISSAPVVLDGDAYIVLNGGGMYCVSAYKGEERWLVPDVRMVLAVSPTRVYAGDIYGQTLVLDKATGALVDRLDTTEVLSASVRPTNLSNDRLIIVSDLGLVHCLHESTLQEPVPHRQPVLPSELPPPAAGAPPTTGP